MEQYFSEIVELKQENIQLKQENIVATKSIDTLQKENIQLKQDIQNKESVVTFEKDKIEALAAQREHYIDKHEQIIVKLRDRFSIKLGDIVKPLEDTIDSISRENRNLTKKISLLESERQFYKTETRRSLDLKGAQKEPMNLSSKGKTNPKNSVSWTIPGD